MASLLCVPAGAGGPAAASPRRVADPVRGEDAVARPRPTSVTTAVESRPRDGDRRLGGARAWDGVRSTGSLATMAPQAGGQAAGAELQARLQKQLMLIEGRGSVNVDSQMRLVPVSPTPPAPAKGYHWAPSPGTHPQLGFSSGSQARPLVAVPSVQSVPWHGTTEPAGGRRVGPPPPRRRRSERVSSGAVQRPPQQPSGAPGCGAPQETTRRLSKPPPPSTPVTPTQPAHPTPRGTPAGTRQGFATMWPGACRDDAQTGASPLRLTTGGRVSVTAAVPEAASRPQRLSAEVGLVARGAPAAPPPTYSRPADAWGVQRPSAEAQLQQLQQELQRERLELQRERLKNEELMHHSSLQGLGQVSQPAGGYTTSCGSSSWTTAGCATRRRLSLVVPAALDYSQKP
ncbi:unnamed protein product [Prorocentrum cordatum]|uniref:Uncharacterized protein n=1 Tax=Prorocentrum cordatum TaxID=2364126 RepID=A0ABN9VBL5_9DINO|nr:unnamed protein product [Polarella glacialis]